MSNGTSQGLFIVVAIVIFGLFVGLSYTVFGENLKPALVGIFGDATEQAQTSLNKSEMSTWLWVTEHIVNKPDEVIKNLKEKNVKTVYLQINFDVEYEHYQYFIKKARKEGISVHALGGSPDWVDKDAVTRWALQEDFYNWIRAYQKDVARNERFTGLHLDIEPHASQLWGTEPNTLVENYQTATEYALEESKNLNLPLALDIPLWFDEQEFETVYGTGNVYDWLLDIGVKEFGIMAFRDTADGQNGIVELTKTELEKAKERNVKITISVETQPFDSANEGLSFSDEGSEFMYDELLKIQNHYSKNSSLKGFNIHYYDSWMILKD